MDSLLIIGIGLLGLGVLLIVLEAFVPSGGILGLSALVSAIVGVVFLFRYDMMWGAIGSLGTVILGPMAFWWAVEMLPSTPLGRTMLGPGSEEIAQQRRETTKVQLAGREDLVGKSGVAATDMRPSGVIEVDGARHDAIAVGGVIDRGHGVRVSKVDGLTIEVRGEG